ncbi:hypothetical protein D3C74_324400 [compost metagenome]
MASRLRRSTGCWATGRRRPSKWPRPAGSSRCRRIDATRCRLRRTAPATSSAPASIRACAASSSALAAAPRTTAAPGWPRRWARGSWTRRAGRCRAAGAASGSWRGLTYPRSIRGCSRRAWSWPATSTTRSAASAARPACSGRRRVPPPRWRSSSTPRLRTTPRRRGGSWAGTFGTSRGQGQPAG